MNALIPIALCGSVKKAVTGFIAVDPDTGATIFKNVVNIIQIYTKKYRELIESCPFRKTNELESWLFDNCQDKINPYIRSFKQSKAVNIPSNNHSLCTQADNSLPFEEVNSKFLDGYRFRLKEVEDTKIVGCHQLISLVMERE